MNNDTSVFAEDLLQLLKRGLDKEKLKPEIESLLNKYERKHSLYPLTQDLIYHVGLFKPTSHDYRFKNRAYSFDEGINHYIQRLETMLLTGNFVFDEGIYELYWRWLYYKEDKIEVGHIHSSDTYELFKDVSQDDYYFLVDFGVSVASSYETLKVSDINLTMDLKAAVQNKDKFKIRQIANKLIEDQKNQ